jgi:transcriptional regulator of acetoin/glycerol metabolism
MPSYRQTEDPSEALVDDARPAHAPEPGLVIVFTGGRPAAIPIPLTGGGLELGRDHPAFGAQPSHEVTASGPIHRALAQPDVRMSRRHVRVCFDGRRFTVTDLGSRNGTSADGAPLRANAPEEVTRVIRVGDSLLVPMRDTGPIRRSGVRVVSGRVEGPALREAREAAAQAARLGTTLHITGESGAGKEGLARTFHACGPPGGPFQAVNCATIPEGVAERLLFGTKKGAFSGADADADGYVQAAHGGTLFLDEVAELSLPVQAKLLRVIETGEVLPLGAARSRKIDLRICSATHRDLRAQVAAGKLREDLFFRIATPRVTAPPLRERGEEIPWLLQTEVERTAPGLSIHVSLVETCLLRTWPGNVRELLAEARTAAQTAHATGCARVEAKHLSEAAGSSFAPPSPEPQPKTGPESPSPLPPTRARLVGLLKRVSGNVSAAARELGVHRTQLRRWMERYGLDARTSATTIRTRDTEDDPEG